MPTYDEVRAYAKQEYGVVGIADCNIAYCKRLSGLPFKPRTDDPVVTCPRVKAEPILKTFRHFGSFDDLSEKQFEALIEKVKSQLKG